MAEVLARPRVVALVDPVDAVEEVRDPADAALGQRHPQVGELAQHRGPQEVGGGLHDVDGLQGDQHVDRRVRRGHHQLRGRPDVQAHDRALVGARLPEGVPVVAVEAGELQLLGVLRERDGVAALGRHPAHLGRHLLGVPQRRQRQGDEAARVRPAPLVDVPVVVGLEDGQPDVLVLGAGKELAAQLGERREAHRPQHAVGVHVADALVDVPAALPHLVEGRGLEAVLLGRAADDGVEPDVGELLALEEPGVAAVLPPDEPGRLRPPPLGQVALEHVGGLDDVVVDADQDQVLHAHGSMLARRG